MGFIDTIMLILAYPVKIRESREREEMKLLVLRFIEVITEIGDVAS